MGTPPAVGGDVVFGLYVACPYNIVYGGLAGVIRVADLGCRSGGDRVSGAGVSREGGRKEE